MIFRALMGHENGQVIHQLVANIRRLTIYLKKIPARIYIAARDLAKETQNHLNFMQKKITL